MRPALVRSALAVAAAWAAATPVGAAELIDAWTAAQARDRPLAVARASRAAAQPKRDEAASLWRPQVGLSATAGVAGGASETTGAQFGAPGFGTSNDVAFATSISSGPTVRWALQATQPLYRPQRRAEQQQLALAADLADIEWRAAAQAAMLRTAERYFALALAERSIQVLEQQQSAVDAAAREAEDRFKLGSAPITDTHETRARLASVRAQWLAARTDAQVKRRQLSDSMGDAPAGFAARLPAQGPRDAAARSIDDWTTDALAGNPALQAQRLAREMAQAEAAKFAPGAATAIDLVAQASRDRASGHGDFGSAGYSASNRMVGVQLTLPLFTGGWRDARQQQAQKAVDKAEAEFERAKEQVAQDVQAVWLSLEAGGARLAALEQALAASEARLDATTVGHEVGERTTLDLLNAENDRAGARLALAQARVGLWLDRLRLATLAGQLDETLLRAADADLAPAAGR